LGVVDEKCNAMSPITGFALVTLLTFAEIIGGLPGGAAKWGGHAVAAFAHADNLLLGGPDRHGLTRDMIAAIHFYTQEGFYEVINGVLRNEDRALVKPYFAYLKLLLTALGKLPRHSGSVWRGVAADLRDLYPQGLRDIWWAISSCTVDGTALKNPLFLGETGARTLFNLESPHLGVDISTYSAYKTEAEVIMPCGLVSDVQTVFTPADGLTVVHLKVDVDATAKMIDFELETTLPLAAAAAEPRSVNIIVDMAPLGGDGGGNDESEFVLKASNKLVT